MFSIGIKNYHLCKLVRVIVSVEEISHLLKVSIRLVGVKYLIAVHHRDEVFGLTEVDDVMCVAWEHVDALDVVARDFKFDDFICS